MTMMACDEALMDQDQWLSEFLTSSPALAVDGETLTLVTTPPASRCPRTRPLPVRQRRRGGQPEQHAEGDGDHRRARRRQRRRAVDAVLAEVLRDPQQAERTRTSSQNAGMKDTKAGGPLGCRAAQTATGVITSAPTNADSTRRGRARRGGARWSTCAAHDVEDEDDPCGGLRPGALVHYHADPEKDHADPRCPCRHRIRRQPG